MKLDSKHKFYGQKMIRRLVLFNAGLKQMSLCLKQQFNHYIYFSTV